MREPGEGVGVAAAPETGGPYVQSGGEWVAENVYGMEYFPSAFDQTPEEATAIFQTYVKHTITVLGGLYVVIAFLAVTADSGNSRVESRITVQPSAAASVNDGGSYAGDGVFEATQASTSGAGTGASFTVTVTGGEVVSVDGVITPGSGYVAGDTITVTVAGEIAAAVLDVDAVPELQTLLVSRTFTSAGDVLPLNARIPLGLAPGTYDVFTEYRHPVSPGTVTAVAGGTETLRAA